MKICLFISHMTVREAFSSQMFWTLLLSFLAAPPVTTENVSATYQNGGWTDKTFIFLSKGLLNSALIQTIGRATYTTHVDIKCKNINLKLIWFYTIAIIKQAGTLFHKQIGFDMMLLFTIHFLLKNNCCPSIVCKYLNTDSLQTDI